jgi:hypothetical protein
MRPDAHRGPLRSPPKQLAVLCAAATPHNINSPVAAKRIKALYPNAKVVAVLKEPAWRMYSAYNQFSKPFVQSCNVKKPADWCPVYRYYQLQLPSLAEAARQELEYVRSNGAKPFGSM